MKRRGSENLRKRVCAIMKSTWGATIKSWVHRPKTWGSIGSVNVKMLPVDDKTKGSKLPVFEGEVLPISFRCPMESWTSRAFKCSSLRPFLAVTSSLVGLQVILGFDSKGIRWNLGYPPVEHRPRAQAMVEIMKSWNHFRHNVSFLMFLKDTEGCSKTSPVRNWAYVPQHPNHPSCRWRWVIYLLVDVTENFRYLKWRYWTLYGYFGAGFSLT